MHYRIRVAGEPGPLWSEWFPGLTAVAGQGETCLTGHLPDQAALHGVLARLRDLNLRLLSVSSEDDDDHAAGGAA